jgi:TPR repeat protein
MSSFAQANRESAARGQGPEEFFKLGMMCSTGQSIPIDMVAAHKWFNLAALRGSKDAVRLRNEVAAEMSAAEIAAAQRAARAWLTQH